MHAERCQAAGTRWEDAALRDATLSGCDLSDARLARADLAGANVTESRLDRADLAGASLAGASTAGISVLGAQLEEARDWAGSREIVAAVLRPHVEDDDAALELLGAIVFLRRRCWRAWAPVVAAQPRLRARAEELFARYPRSGCAEAFAAGLEEAAGDATPTPLR
jgi:hypothetical protein